MAHEHERRLDLVGPAALPVCHVRPPDCVGTANLGRLIGALMPQAEGFGPRSKQGQGLCPWTPPKAAPLERMVFKGEPPAERQPCLLDRAHSTASG